jgi:hypothetical protein
MIRLLNSFIMFLEMISFFFIWINFWFFITCLILILFIWVILDTFYLKVFTRSSLTHLAKWFFITAFRNMRLKPSCVNLAVWLNQIAIKTVINFWIFYKVVLMVVGFGTVPLSLSLTFMKIWISFCKIFLFPLRLWSNLVNSSFDALLKIFFIVIILNRGEVFNIYSCNSVE